MVRVIRRNGPEAPKAPAAYTRYRCSLVDITHQRIFRCLGLTKISQKIDNFIAGVSQYENIGAGGKDPLREPQLSAKGRRWLFLSGCSSS